MQESSVRVFIPLSFSDLESEQLEPQLVFAVTPKVASLGESYGYDQEDCEGLAADYAAMHSCAFESNQRRGRRLVACVEVTSQLTGLDNDGVGSALLGQPVSWRQVQSFLADGEPLGDLVERAACDEAAWDELSSHYLEWFDVSEKTDLAS